MIRIVPYRTKYFLPQRLAKFSFLTGAFAVVVGCVVLAGWALDVPSIKSVFPALAVMKANTALCFVLSGSALMLWHLSATSSFQGRKASVARIAARVCAALVVIVGAIVLCENAVHWNAGIDELFFRDTATQPPAVPGRMSPATAFAFVVLGAGLLFTIARTNRSARIAQVLAVVIIVTGVLSLFGYLYNVHELYAVRLFVSVALHTAATFVVIGVGVLLARPAHGWIQQLTANTSSALMSRRLLLSACVLFPLIAWLRVQGQQLHWFGPQFGLAMQTACGMIVIAGLIWFNTRAANAAELRLRYLNRLYAVLTEINGLIVHAHDVTDLFEQSCRIAVDVGQFPFAWFGMVDREGDRVVPVASAGTAGGLLENPDERFMIGASPDASPISEVVLTGRPVVINDLTTASSVPFRAEMLAQGIRSVAKLPLTLNGEVIGVFVLHAEISDFFDQDEMALLAEMAGDIAFALDHIEKERKLGYLAYYDALTGLANVVLLRDRLKQRLAEAKRDGVRVALMIIDILHFKMINDTFGRTAGDEVLRHIAIRLTAHFCDAGPLARVGPDYFAAILTKVESETDIVHAQEQLVRECFDVPFHIGGESILVSVRAGVAVFPDDAADESTLFSNAEAALKNAKHAGDKCLFYSSKINDSVAERVRLEMRLRAAVQRQQFVLHYQPKVDTQTRRIVSLEALIRWQSPELGLVAPMRFIPLLEEMGLINEVGAWALRQAATDIAHFKQTSSPDVRVAVNVSAVQLRQTDFVETVVNALGSEASGSTIDLEITESLIMENIEASIAKLREISALGIRIAIDDFGTGYSSLAYLAKLPVHFLKIDRVFVMELPNEPDAVTLIGGMITLAHSLGLNVIAEGVETEEQASLLQEFDCDELQGYLISKPLPLQECLQLVERHAQPSSN